MTEDQKFLLFIAIVILALVDLVRYPAVVRAFCRKATARCRDGSMSFSVHRCGTCSHRGGVAEFLASAGTQAKSLS